MKKLSVILLALLLTLFCAACGNDESPDKEKNETGKVTTTVTDSAEPDVGNDADETEDEESCDEDENDWEGEDCDDEDHHSTYNPEGNEVNENGGITTCGICGEKMLEEESYDHQCDAEDEEEYDTFDENEEVFCFDCDMVMAVEEWQDHLNAYHGGSKWAECPYCGREYSICGEDHGECTEEGA